MRTEAVERILVATDGSEDSMEAETRAAELASALQARVALLHVAPRPVFGLGTTQLGQDVPEPGPEDDVGLVKAVWEGSQAILDRGTRTLEAAGVPVEGLVREGEPVEEILGLLEDDPFDMIILGRHGRGGTDQGLGSTASAVAMLAGCPVLLVGSVDRGTGTGHTG